jgi:hypothetical protein
MNQREDIISIKIFAGGAAGNPHAGPKPANIHSAPRYMNRTQHTNNTSPTNLHLPDGYTRPSSRVPNLTPCYLRSRSIPNPGGPEPARPGSSTKRPCWIEAGEATSIGQVPARDLKCKQQLSLICAQKAEGVRARVVVLPWLDRRPWVPILAPAQKPTCLSPHSTIKRAT